MALLKDERTWTLIDEGNRGKWETTRGTIVPNKAQLARTHDEQLAAEIKAIDPSAIVVEHEPFKGDGLRGGSIIRVPEKPWKSEPSENWIEVSSGRWIYRPASK